MKTRQKKAGFTLVELMVVAIIVAILAAVAIPLMSGNKDRAAATEAQSACSTIKTAVRVSQVDGKTWTSTINDLVGIDDGDLDGNYFDHGDYSISGAYSNYTVTASTSASGDDAKASGVSGTVTMDVVNGTEVTWGGTLLD